jgi:Pleckstrin homology domain
LLNPAHELYFWFGEEAVEAKKFSTFLSKAATDYAHNAAAWSSQTGKGLLYYAKNKESTDAPLGVLPLVSENSTN